jgi:hypothetical protein
MKTSWTTVVLVAALFLVTSCSDEVGGTPADTGMNDMGTMDAGDDADMGGGEGPSFDDFIDARATKYLRAACRSAFQCPEGQEPDLVTGVFSRFADQQQCESKLPDFFLPFRTPSQSDLDDGLTTYDPSAAQQCLDALDQAINGDACTLALQAAPPIESCYTAFNGTVAEGDPCVRSYHCATGFCDLSANSECYGECVPAAALGETCGTASSPACQPWLTCQRDLDGAEVCVEVGSSGDGDPCADDRACGGGAGCDFESSPRTCDKQDLKTDGETCDESSDFCEPSTACLGADQFSDGTCGATKASGESCQDSDECQWGLYCDSGSGECTETLAEGDICEGSDACGFRSSCNASPIGSCEDQDPDTCELP